MQTINQLSQEEKLFWFSYIETKIGLVLPEIQQRRFESRILERMQKFSLSSDEYFRLVKLRDDEWQSLIDDLTIPETSFFRHKPSYDLYTQFLEQKKQTAHIWSVGCATGEEAWSLAMIADSILSNYKIMATDVSESAVTKGQQGIYSIRKLSTLPEGFQELYFKPVDSAFQKANSVTKTPLMQINDRLKSRVSFYRHNLIDKKRLPFREIDVVFCHNVLIYFRNFVQRDILNELVKSLSIGGILVMGPAEARGWSHPKMQRYEYPGTLAFQRIK